MAKKKGKIKMKKIKLWMMLFCIGLLFVSGGVAEEMAEQRRLFMEKWKREDEYGH